MCQLYITCQNHNTSSTIQNTLVWWHTLYIPVGGTLNNLSGAQRKNRWPRGHSYSRPTKTRNTTSTMSETATHKTVSYTVSEWVGGVWRHIWHITREFRDEPFQKINCTGTENQRHNSQEKYKKNLTLSKKKWPQLRLNGLWCRTVDWYVFARKLHYESGDHSWSFHSLDLLSRDALIIGN